jgi:hypothetical protein
MVATAEVKTVLPQADPHGPDGHAHKVSDRRTAVGAHHPAPEGAS